MGEFKCQFTNTFVKNVERNLTNCVPCEMLILQSRAHLARASKRNASYQPVTAQAKVDLYLDRGEIVAIVAVGHVHLVDIN